METIVVHSSAREGFQSEAGSTSMISEIRSQTQLRFIKKKIIFGTYFFLQTEKTQRLFKVLMNVNNMSPSRRTARLALHPHHLTKPTPLYFTPISRSLRLGWGQLYSKARRAWRRVFRIWDGIVTSSVCPQAEYPINEWSSLTSSFSSSSESYILSYCLLCYYICLKAESL